MQEGGSGQLKLLRSYSRSQSQGSSTARVRQQQAAPLPDLYEILHGSQLEHIQAYDLVLRAAAGAVNHSGATTWPPARPHPRSSSTM